MTLNEEIKNLYYACRDMENHIWFINSNENVNKNGMKFYLKDLKDAIERFEKSGWLESKTTENEK